MATVTDENSLNAPNITTRGRVGAKKAAPKSKNVHTALETPLKGDAEEPQTLTDVTSVRVLLRVRPMSAIDMRLGYHSEFVSCTDTRCAVQRRRPRMGGVWRKDATLGGRGN
jgi:hypothetical protein